MHIRPMVESDLDQVIINESSAYAFPWTRGTFLDCLKGTEECWVGERQARVVAHAVLTVGAGESHLLNVCVREDLQGRGYGRQLVMHQLNRARISGAGALFLEVRPSNDVAARLYDSLGFREVGVRRDYYPSHLGQEDARVLALDLESFFTIDRQR